MTLEALQKRIAQLEEAQAQGRILKTVLDDALKEDDTYQEVDAALRDLNLKKKRIREEIYASAANQETVAKLKDIKEEIADISDVLDHELLEWRQTHNTEEIIAADGTTRKLKVKVRLATLPHRGG